MARERPQQTQQYVIPNYITWIYMKKISKKQPTPLIALFGFKPGTAIPGVTNVDTSVRVDLDWMKLHFGRDEQKQEFVCATAGKHSFLLCTTPPEGGRRRKPANKTGWVYLVNSLPTEMLPPWAISRELVYAGFKVTSGRDGVDFHAKLTPLFHPKLTPLIAV